MIRLARNMVHFYVVIVPEVVGEYWRECQAVARSRR